MLWAALINSTQVYYDHWVDDFAFHCPLCYFVINKLYSTHHERFSTLIIQSSRSEVSFKRSLHFCRVQFVTLVWNFSPVLLQKTLGTEVFLFWGHWHTTHRSEDRRTRNVTKANVKCFPLFILISKRPLIHKVISYQTLCPTMVRKSTPSWQASTGIFPRACAASVCSRILSCPRVLFTAFILWQSSWTGYKK